MTAVAGQAEAGPILEQVLARAADPDRWERFERQMRLTGYCRRPVRLQGQVDAVDVATGDIRTVYTTADEPDETLLKACGNRREAVCPSCAQTYRGDAFQLVAAGMRGGKGVPESVVEHPMLFVTLTAPSFGLVHSQRLDADGRARRCRPRRRAEVCRHGVWLSCREVHGDDDPRVGEPLCPRCFEYEHAVLWNAMAPELWRRTAIRIPRELARLTGVSERVLRGRVRVSFAKVAEYQRRGALHFHVVMRLDAAQPRATADRVQPPPREYSCGLFARAVLAAVQHVSTSAPTPDDGDDAPMTRARELRWGPQTEVRAISDGGVGVADTARTADYLAKYATKSTETVGGLMHPLEAEDLPDLRVRPHVRRLIQCAWRLGAEEHLQGLRLRRWAHALGFRGHCFTKSRRYSTTFTQLRRARHEHVVYRLHGGERRDPWDRPVSERASVELPRWAFAGTGYRTLGDAWLAESGAARARERRRVAREEIRSGPPSRNSCRRLNVEAGGRS
jgi:hypothetical protein